MARRLGREDGRMSHVSRGRSLRGWVRELTGGGVLLGEYLGCGFAIESESR